MNPPNLPGLAPDLYTRALWFAAAAHGDQRVPGNGFPYVVHLALVTHELAGAIAADPTLGPALAIPVGVLHDVLEDTETTPAAIQAAFGDHVLAGVKALSKNASLPKEERLADSLRRIRAAPREVWVVKLADRTANLLPPPKDWTAEKAAKYRDEAGQILAALGEASPFLAARLADRIARYPHTHP